jgi:hypothetical protein
VTSVAEKGAFAIFNASNGALKIPETCAKSGTMLAEPRLAKPSKNARGIFIAAV